MGTFTGKSDFEDIVNMHYNPKTVLNGDVLMNGAKLKLETERDLIPFYPYLCSMMSAEKMEDGSTKTRIELCNKSFIDSTEERQKTLFVEDIAYFCKKNKKKATEITLEDVKDLFNANHIFDENTLKKIVDIVSKGKSAYAFGIVVSSYNLKKKHEFVDCIIESFTKQYLYNIRTKTATQRRKDLLKYASENGWSKKYNCDGLNKENANNYFINFNEEKNSNINTILNRVLYKVIESV